MDRQDLIAVIKNMPEAVICLDPDGKITVFNRKAERITGHSEQDAAGKTFKELFCFDLLGPDCEIKSRLLANSVVPPFETAISTMDKKRVPVSISPVLLRNNREDASGYVVTLRDLNEPKRRGKDIRSRHGFSNIISRNQRMQEVFDLVETISDCDVSVLIQGESGTGKELIAHAIHEHSQRQSRPFVVLNCGAISETLLESELFGHVKGAFSGAYRDKEGSFEAAGGGTLFLDEIGDISLNMQTRLLRVIQTGKFEKVGDNRTVQVDVRIISATNKVLKEEIVKGNFREDLYYRLNVVPVFLPPLRERKTDIPLLVRHFMEIFNAKNNRDIKDISPEAMSILVDYDWPGNIRELKNLIECSLVCTKNNMIDTSGIPLFIKENIRYPDRKPGSLIGHEHFSEKDKIMFTLKDCLGNKKAAAEILNMDRTTLWRKIKRYGISANSVLNNTAN